jgi:protein CpxP
VNKLIASTLVSIGLTAASLSLATAQAAAPPAPGAAQNRMDARHHHQKRAFSLPSERVEARLAYVKTALKITDAQQAQWNAFADVARRQAVEQDKQMQARRARMEQRSPREKPTVIARMERQQQRHAAAIARLNERLAVQKPLYAALSPDQKAIADEVLAPRGHRGGFPQHGRRSAG